MTYKHRRTLALATLLTSMLFAAVPALAQDAKETARDAYSKGRDAFEAGNYQEASSELAKSWRLVRMPDTALWAAMASEKEGKLVEAARLYREAIALTPDASWPKEAWKVQAQQKAQQEAQSKLSALSPRIPSVSIEAANRNLAELQVAIDGSKLPTDSAANGHELDPGNHTVSVTTKDGQTQTQLVTLAEGERRSVRFEFASSSALSTRAPSVPSESATKTAPPGVVSPPRGHAAPDKQKTSTAPDQPKTSTARAPFPVVGWVAAGVGAAGLLAGATAGAIALAKYKQADCGSNHECDDATYDRYAPSYDRWRNVSTVGFIVGGVGAAAVGITWLVTTPKREHAEPLSVAVGLGGLAMKGTF
ncbi:MAG TPA: hypothetical protein VKP30_08110 [Polyangiaceae bacterium]|nr:hypothetical protein [Polyangiaceae bacterium]